jgi:hypothetical protein
MKFLFSLLAALIASHYSYAQTNTFPSSGNVGIGTTTPVNALNIIANSPAYADPQYTSGIRINDASNTTGLVMGVVSDYNNGYIQMVQPNVSWSTRSLILQSMGGNVGIGTPNPLEKLDVAGNIVTSNACWFSSRPTSGATVSLLGIAPDNNVYMGDAFGVLNTKVILRTSGIDRMTIVPSGNVGIGTTSPDAKLAVNGTIHTKEVKVDLTGWPDYVFKPSYFLRPLSEVKAFIDQNHRLPEMPSDKEVAEKGLDLGETNKLLTKKVEELTLYIIEQNKRLDKLERQIKPKHGMVKKEH